MDTLTKLAQGFNTNTKPLPNLGNSGDPFDFSGYSLGTNGLQPSPPKVLSNSISAPTSTPIASSNPIAQTTSPISTPITPVSNSLTGQTPETYFSNSPTNNNAFSIDTSGATSDHLANDNTPDTVGAYRNQLQQNFDAYHAAQQPLQTALGTATQYSPQELAAQQSMVNFTNSYNQGINAIRGQNIPLEFQQGQESALTRDASLQQSALSSNLNYLENIRQNNIAAINSQIGLNQQNFENQNTALTTGQNYGLQAEQTGIQQQSANQNRYDYQQITDPNTGFPVIQVTDKQTGLPAGTISPSSSAGQQIMQNINSQGGLSNGVGSISNNNGNAIVQSTMQMMGATQDMPVSQALQTLGVSNIVKGLINQEGGSPQGVVNNPGNIKFNNLPGQVDSGVKATDGGTFASYSTPQAGIMGVAGLVQNAAKGGANLSDFIASYKGVQNTQNQPTTMSQQLQQLVNAAPTQIKNAVKLLPDGTPYIDGSLVGSQFMAVANNFSAQSGVRILSSNDTSTIDSAKQAIANLGAYAATFENLAPTGFGGKVGHAITNPASKLFGTDYGSQLKAFQQNRDGLLQQIRTLAGSSPRLNANELNMAATSVPQLGGLGSDTLQDGVTKLTLTAQYLDNAIRAIDPNYIGTPIAVNGQYAVRLSDGINHYYPTKDAALSALQLNQQQ